MTHRESHVQVGRQPGVGEIVIVKDDHLPRRAWKLAKIREFIFSRDGLIRSVKIQLPNRKVISRSINYLFPFSMIILEEMN